MKTIFHVLFERLVQAKRAILHIGAFAEYFGDVGELARPLEFVETAQENLLNAVGEELGRALVYFCVALHYFDEVFSLDLDGRVNNYFFHLLEEET